MASPWFFSRRGVETWLYSGGTGFSLAFLYRATAARSAACDWEALRFRVPEAAARALTALFCRLGPHATCGLLALQGVLEVLKVWAAGCASKLGMERQLLGPGSLLLVLLSAWAGCRGRLRQANPALAWT